MLDPGAFLRDLLKGLQYGVTPPPQITQQPPQPEVMGPPVAPPPSPFRSPAIAAAPESPPAVFNDAARYFFPSGELFGYAPDTEEGREISRRNREAAQFGFESLIGGPEMKLAEGAAGALAGLAKNRALGAAEGALRPPSPAFASSGEREARVQAAAAARRVSEPEARVVDQASKAMDAIRKANQAKKALVTEGTPNPFEVAIEDQIQGIIPQIPEKVRDLVRKGGVSADEFAELIEAAHKRAHVTPTDQSRRLVADAIMKGKEKFAAPQQSAKVPGFAQTAEDKIRLRAAVETPADLPRETTFKTAKGSTYKVNSDGTTARNKAARPEHPGDAGPMPVSQKTIYVDDPDALGIFQTEGKKKFVIDSGKGMAGVRFLEGPNAGKIARTSVTPFTTQPGVGKYPVEVWDNGTKVHFGNKIVEVGDDLTDVGKSILGDQKIANEIVRDIEKSGVEIGSSKQPKVHAKLLEETFKKTPPNVKDAKSPAWLRALSYVFRAAAGSRNLVLGGDPSLLFRNSFKVALRDPGSWLRTQATFLKVTAGKADAVKVNDRALQRREQMGLPGLSLSEVGGTSLTSESQFANIKDAPLFGALKHTPIGKWLERNEEATVAAMNTLRVNLADTMMRQEQWFLKRELNDAEKRLLEERVNTFTGRGLADLAKGLGNVGAKIGSKVEGTVAKFTGKKRSAEASAEIGRAMGERVAGSVATGLGNVFASANYTASIPRMMFDFSQSVTRAASALAHRKAPNPVDLDTILLGLSSAGGSALMSLALAKAVDGKINWDTNDTRFSQVEVPKDHPILGLGTGVLSSLGIGVQTNKDGTTFLDPSGSQRSFINLVSKIFNNRSVSTAGKVSSPITPKFGQQNVSDLLIDYLGNRTYGPSDFLLGTTRGDLSRTDWGDPTQNPLIRLFIQSALADGISSTGNTAPGGPWRIPFPGAFTKEEEAKKKGVNDLRDKWFSAPSFINVDRQQEAEIFRALKQYRALKGNRLVEDVKKDVDLMRFYNEAAGGLLKDYYGVSGDITAAKESPQHRELRKNPYYRDFSPDIEEILTHYQ